MIPQFRLRRGRRAAGASLALLVLLPALMVLPRGSFATAEIHPVLDPPPVRQEVRIRNGAIELAGSLLLPAGGSPSPAVVIVHGSGTSDRSNPWTKAWAVALLARGIAVLHPDKRGSGESDGNWRTTSFEELAGDALAGVRFLREHAAIDATNVGVIGFSQGGHVVAAAAAASEEVAFAIDVSGSTVPILEQIGDEVLSMGERAGLGEAELALIAEVHEAGERFALTGEGWSEYATDLARAKAGRLAGTDVVEGFPELPSSTAWDFLRAVGNFDPMEHWTKVQAPVAFVFGGRDTQVRVSKSISRIQEVLAPLERNVTVLLFHSNGHALFREDAADFLATWIRSRGES